MQQSFISTVDAEITPSPNYPATPTVYITEVHIKFSAHPSTPEEITATYKTDENPDIANLLFKADPSSTDADGNDITEIRWTFSERFPLKPGERINVEYPNSDSNTVSVTFIHQYS